MGGDGIDGKRKRRDPDHDGAGSIFGAVGLGGLILIFAVGEARAWAWVPVVHNLAHVNRWSLLVWGSRTGTGNFSR